MINTDLSPTRAHILSSVSPMDLGNQISMDSRDVQDYSSPVPQERPAQKDAHEERLELLINEEALEIAKPDIDHF